MKKSKIKNQKSNLHIKIQNFGFCIVILIFAFCILNSNCFAKPVSSTELIEHAKEYNGKIVSFQGEVIGDIMKRGNFAWINLNDGANAIGIWLKADLTKDITYLGGYKFKGDIVEAEGRFNRACLEHGGDLDIHADTLKIINIGEAIEEKLDIQKYKAALGLLGVVLCLGILRKLKIKPKKK